MTLRSSSSASATSAPGAPARALNVGGDGFSLHLLPARRVRPLDALLVVFELGQASVHLCDLVFHGGNVAQGARVVVDAALRRLRRSLTLAISSSMRVCLAWVVSA